MIDDPIVAEIRAERERHAAAFNYDLDAIYRDLVEKERTSGRVYVRFPPRPAKVVNRSVGPSSESSVLASN